MEFPKFNDAANTKATTSAPSLDFATIMLASNESASVVNPKLLEEIRQASKARLDTKKTAPIDPNRL